MEHDGNDVDAAFEALIAREFGEVVTAPGRPRPRSSPPEWFTGPTGAGPCSARAAP